MADFPVFNIPDPNEVRRQVREDRLAESEGRSRIHTDNIYKRNQIKGIFERISGGNPEVIQADNVNDVLKTVMAQHVKLTNATPTEDRMELLAEMASAVGHIDPGLAQQFESQRLTLWAQEEKLKIEAVKAASSAVTAETGARNADLAEGKVTTQASKPFRLDQDVVAVTTHGDRVEITAEAIGNFEGALQTDPFGAAALMTTVPGLGQIYIPLSAVSRAVVESREVPRESSLLGDYKTALLLRANLMEINKLRDSFPEVLSYMGRMKKVLFIALDKAGVSTDSQKEFIRIAQTLRGAVQFVFVQIREEVTGAQAADIELKKLEQATLAIDMSDTQLAAAIDRLDRGNEIAINAIIQLRNDGIPRSPEEFNKKFDEITRTKLQSILDEGASAYTSEERLARIKAL